MAILSLQSGYQAFIMAALSSYYGMLGPYCGHIQALTMAVVSVWRPYYGFLSPYYGHTFIIAILSPYYGHIKPVLWPY